MIPNIFSLLGESIVGKHIAKGIIFSNSPKKFHPNGSRIQVICYNSRVSAVFPNRRYFFPRNSEKPYSVQALCYNFGIIWKKTFPGWEGNLPRIYDFRHHFAWATINRWAREGIDVNAMIPYLMRYMGHNCIKHTLYYFRFVPDFYADYKALSSRLNGRIPEVPDE